ncbi:MAG: hypothetical protein GXY74_14280 [Phycisphaerae bacterium]|nr:hypothetical protein [Phycisphaerae bacterium]
MVAIPIGTSLLEVYSKTVTTPSGEIVRNEFHRYFSGWAPPPDPNRPGLTIRPSRIIALAQFLKRITPYTGIR